MTAKKRGTDLGSALRGITARLDRKSGGGLTQVRVATAWDKVAGPTVNEHTTGAHLRERELVVFVDSPVWATELSALASQYQKAINEEIGQELVTSVRFSVSRRVQTAGEIESQERAALDERKRDVVESVPLTPQERAQVEASASGIPDQELRQAVIRATIADLEWKKGLAASKSRETRREGS